MPEFPVGSRRLVRLFGLVLVLCLIASACVSTVDSDARPGEEPVEGTDETETATDTRSAEPENDADSIDAGDETPPPVGALADPASLASIEPMGCSFDEPVPLSVEPTCYALSVPEDWGDPDPADAVVLQVAVFEGSGGTEDPIIYFDGGPGGHTLDVLSFTFSNLVEPFLAERDYIVFDQRGLGQSEPSLACDELTELALADLAGTLDPDDAADAAIDAQNACRDRLVGSGVNLAAYNSIASSNDVEAMRSLLGYEELNVIGISYGTRLAQSFMRMYPNSVRSVVLDSVFPTGYDLWSNFNPAAIRAFEQLFDGCAASASCQQAYPELEDRFFELLDQLDAEPAQLEVQNLITGATVPMRVDGDDLMGLVFSALYDRAQFAAVPQMVEDGLDGDYSTIELFGSIMVSNFDFVSLGMRFSVECNEEIPFESEEVFEANLPVDGPYARLGELDGGLTLFDSCDQWPAGVAPDVEADTVMSDLPTLLLAGQYDPITPPSGVDLVAAGLSRSYSFLLPNEGHGIAPSPCGSELVNAFIADPEAEPAADCIATSPEPVWVAGSDTTPVTLVPFEVSGLVSVNGLRPEGWTDAGNGVFTRQQTAVDPTTLLIQPTGGLPADSLVELLSGQLEIALAADEPLDIDGTTWDHYSSAAASEPAARVAVRSGDDAILVLLVASSGEIDAIYDQLFIDVAAAADVG